MKRAAILKHEFVEYIPANLMDGTVYVSMNYAVAQHRCCCGCGNKVITPFSPTDWELTFNGESISLDPSIGNWSFPCQSHYWITRNRVRWAGQWSLEEIETARTQDQLAKEEYFCSPEKPIVGRPRRTEAGERKPRESIWRKLKTWWFSSSARS